MTKVLLEFPAGAKGDLLVSHFNNRFSIEEHGKTSVYDTTNIRKTEFLINNNLIFIDKKLQEYLLKSLLDSDTKLTSVHNLKSIFDNVQIDKLLERLNVVQLYVEKEFYNQVKIDFTVKVLCKKLTTYEKVSYRKLLIEKYGSFYKKYNLQYRLDWEIISNDIELNDENRVIFLKNYLKSHTSKENKDLKEIEEKYTTVYYSKLFFEPFEDYYKLCDMLNHKPDINDLVYRIKNSFIPNPLIFANASIDLTEFGYKNYI